MGVQAPLVGGKYLVTVAAEQVPALEERVVQGNH